MAKKTAHIVDICYSFGMSLSPQTLERNKLFNLMVLMNSKQIEYSAGGYFTISKTTLFELLSVSTTYFIVLVQFKDYLRC